MSDKSWDADAELGSGRSLDFGGKTEDLGGSKLELPERPADVVTEGQPASEQARRRGLTVRPSWIVWLVILAALAGPLFGVAASVITAVDDLMESIDTFEDTTGETDAERPGPVAPENLSFLRTLDGAVSSTATALPECFFDEAASDLCASAYSGLADVVDSTSVTIECSGYRAFWVNALQRAADGRSENLQALYNDEQSAYPFGYAEARTRCVAGDSS